MIFMLFVMGLHGVVLVFKSEYENIKPEEIQELNEELIEDIKDWIEEDRILELEEYLIFR